MRKIERTNKYIINVFATINIMWSSKGNAGCMEKGELRQTARIAQLSDYFNWDIKQELLEEADPREQE